VLSRECRIRSLQKTQLNSGLRIATNFCLKKYKACKKTSRPIIIVKLLIKSISFFKFFVQET